MTKSNSDDGPNAAKLGNVRDFSTEEMVSLRRFRDDLGVGRSTILLWVKRGWLSVPLNIGGRLYLTREQIQEFKRRARSGEFAGSDQPTLLTRSELARRWNVCVHTIARRRDLKPLRFNARLIRYRLVDIQAIEQAAGA